MTQNFNSKYKINVEKLSLKLISITNSFMGLDDAKILIKYIIRAELMGVSTHGLHYFVHTIYPILKRGKSQFDITCNGNVIYSEGRGGDIGILNLHHCLIKASNQSEKSGISLVSIKNPGKVGALRVYAEDLIRNDKLLILLKNTASSQGTMFSKQGLIGTNPICFAFPDSDFIFDTSTTTVATNSIRLMNKQNQKYSNYVGYDNFGNQTKNPKNLLLQDAYLSTFSDGPFWYKSFFLGLAIESLSALAGGKTGDRVGAKKGARLDSMEGMIGIVIDKSAFPHYESYKKEIKLLFNKIEDSGIYIPGNYNKMKKEIIISHHDWEFIDKI